MLLSSAIFEAMETPGSMGLDAESVVNGPGAGRVGGAVGLVGIGADQQMVAGRTVVADGAHHAPGQCLLDVEVEVLDVRVAEVRVDLAESKSGGCLGGSIEIVQRDRRGAVAIGDRGGEGRVSGQDC